MKGQEKLFILKPDLGWRVKLIFIFNFSDKSEKTPPGFVDHKI